MKQRNLTILSLVLCLLLVFSFFWFQFPNVIAVSASTVWDSIATEVMLPRVESKVFDVVETSDGLFVATDMEVYKSTDGGETWILKHNATTGSEALTLYATSKGWLIVAFLGSFPSQRVSKDGGENWIDGSPSVMPWRTGIAELPNGTLLMGMWGGYGEGGVVYKSDDSVNYSLLWNFTQLFPDYPQNHTHAVGFNPYNDKIYVGLGDVIPKLLYVSSDYGQNWVRYTADGPTGMWFEPDGFSYFGPDWSSDDIFKITPSNEIIKLNLLNKYSASPSLDYIVRENNVFYAGICSESADKPVGVAVSPDGDDWITLKIIENREGRTTIKKGLGNYLWIVLDNKLYKARALEQNEVEHLINSEPTVLASNEGTSFVSYAEGIVSSPRVRVYGENVTNLVKNPSFETWSEGQPTGWASFAYPAENWTTIVENATGLFGDRAVRVRASTTSDGIFRFQQWVSTEVGKSYTLSAYFRSNISRRFEPYLEITGEAIDESSQVKTVYENWTRLEVTVRSMDTTSPSIEVGWRAFDLTTSKSGILIDIDAVLFQEGIKATPYVNEGNFATTNPKIKFGETWLNYTGIILHGDYQEFAINQDYLTGTFKVVSLIEGSRIANVTIIGTEIATIQNGVITKHNGETFAGIYYGAPSAEGSKIIILVSSSNYGNITAYSFSNQRLSVTISAPPESTTITKIYIPFNATTQMPFPNDAWEFNVISENVNTTWDGNNRVLTISALHGVAPISIEVYSGKGWIYRIETYLAILAAVGSIAVLAWWQRSKWMPQKISVALTRLKQQFRKILHRLSLYDVAALLVVIAFMAPFFVSPMPELNWDAAGQATTGVFWHDLMKNVVLTGRFDRTGEFVSTFLNHYEDIAEVFYTPIFWGLISSFAFSFSGISEATYYSTMLVFALTALLATYLLASKLYDKRIGLISTLFLASSHALFAYTKSATIDVPATAMVTIAMLAFIKAEADNRLKYLALAGFLVGLSFMTKPTSVFVVMVIALYLVLKHVLLSKRKIRNPMIFGRFERQSLSRQLRNFMIFLVPASILGLIQLYVWVSSNAISSWLYAFAGPPVIDYPWYIYFSWILGEYLSPIIVFLLVVGFVFSLARRKNADLFLLTWFAVSVLFAMFASNRQPRYLLPLVPCLSIFAAQGLVSLYNFVKEKLKAQVREAPIRNLLKTLFILLIIIGVLNGIILIQQEPYRNWVDFANIKESPMDDVAKFLVEKSGIISVLPNYPGWAALQLLGTHYSLPTLGFHIVKYDRQRATYFYGSYVPWETMSNETFLQFLDYLSDIFEGKTVYVVIPYVYNWSWEFLEFLEPSLREYMESLSTYLKPYPPLYSYIESHYELIPLIKVFEKGGIEIRVYQRIKGAF